MTRRDEVVSAAERLDDPGRAVIGTDLQGTVVFWNAGAEALYGWGRDDALGRDIVGVTPSELSRREAEEIMAALRRGIPWSGRFIVRDRDGRRFLAEVTDHPVRDARGDLVGIVGVSHRVEYTSA